MRVRVLAFAQLRELLGESDFDLDLEESARVADVWNTLSRRNSSFEAASNGARIARNGTIAQDGDAVEEGDEIALLPPVGGG